MGADGTLKFDTSLDSGGLQSGMGKVASIAQQALGVFSGQMMTRAVDALVNLGKTALDSVGALEQNIGGVQTLFGDTADAVIAAANRAYQTAGMSANDYMSTVTSFSASLLQSLEDDTEAAAAVADMAIIDMADNANKMGSSMESIQNAYQGFAKQNYTMLDNLKLGYGGTRSEMERLLKDAEALTGIKYDINNLNDVYQAIHVIQEEMDITGTTAAEAAATLEGSMAAAKAAWDNFMNGSSDADQLADALATAAGNIVDNLAEIVPRLAETLPALVGAVAQQIPALTATIISAVVTATSSALYAMIDAVEGFDFAGAAQSAVEMITNFVEGDGLSAFLGSVTHILTGITNGISSMLPTLMPAITQLITYVVTSLIDQLPAFLNCGLNLILGLAQGLLDSLPVLISALPGIINAIVQFIVTGVPQIIAAGITLLMALIEAVPVIVNALVEVLPEILNAIVTILVESVPQILEGGITLLMALIDAIPVIADALVEALPEIIEAMTDAFVEAAPQILDAGITLLLALIDAIPTIVSELAVALPDIIMAIINGLSDAIPEVLACAGEIWDAIVEAIPELLVSLGDAAEDICEALLDGLASLPEKMAEVGSNVISGIWSGISSGWDWLMGKAGELATGLFQSAKDALGIASPSRVFADGVGRWIPPGIGAGAERAMPETLSVMRSQAGRLVSAMQAELNANTGKLSMGASTAMQLQTVGAGTTIYNSRTEQNNTYNVPVASPSEVAKKQREALRNMVGGVK